MLREQPQKTEEEEEEHDDVPSDIGIRRGQCSMVLMLNTPLGDCLSPWSAPAVINCLIDPAQL